MGRRHHHWAVLATKQANSADARRHVQQQGFEILHLMYRESPVHGVRRVLPLFPYYLLVSVNPKLDGWKKLNSTRGVRALFTCEGKPSRIRDEHVERFRELETDCGYYQHPDHVVPTFTSGETVVGVNGLFAGCEGVYQGLAGSSVERVRVLFHILGQPMVREMKAFDLTAAA